jgi:hypothetical protein
MAGLGRKEWSPGDTLTASDVNGYLMDQSVMVFAGTAARASAIPSPSAGMVAYSTATSLQVYDGTDWVDLSTGYGVATGGASTAITVGGTAYTLLTFTSSGTLTVTKSGLFDVLVFGGGAGGMAFSSFGGGGGSGGIVQQTATFTANQTVTIGAGGASSLGGNFSAVGSIPTAISSAGGSNSSSGLGAHGSLGGFSGASNTAAGVGQNNTQGYQGGATTTGSAGGGGGTTAQGNVGTTNVGGAGGAGFDVSAFIGGSALFKGAGGGGGGITTGGAGGSSVGGAGENGSSGGSAAAANTASGGGGRANVQAFAGGSGIVYIRFKV